MRRARTRALFSRRNGVVFGVTAELTARSFLVGVLGKFADRRPVTLICDGQGGDEVARRENARFHEVKIGRDPSVSGDLVALVGLIKAFWRLRPEITVLGTPKMALLGGVAAVLTRVPVRVYVLHGLRLEGAVGARRRALACAEWVTCRLAHSVIAVSPSLRLAAIEAGVVSEDRIRVIGAGTANGIDVEYFRPPTQAERQRARRSLGFAGDERIVAYVGRITHDKGIRELATAWPEIAARCGNARLVLAGDVEIDRRVTSALEGLLARDDVLALGFVDPRPLYWAADLLVLPTYREGFPTVILEAAATFLPSVTTDATGARDAVQHGVTGYLVPPRQAAILASVVGKALHEDARGAMGQAARDRVLENFSREQVVLRFYDHIERCLQTSLEDGPVDAHWSRDVRKPVNSRAPTRLLSLR